MHTDPTPNAGITNEELAEQLYNMLMREIEPDLLTYNLTKLDEYYITETPEEHKNRMRRYDLAYTKFEQEHQAFMSLVTNEVKKSQQNSLKSSESANKVAEVSDVAKVLQNINNA